MHHFVWLKALTFSAPCVRLCVLSSPVLWFELPQRLTIVRRDVSVMWNITTSWCLRQRSHPWEVCLCMEAVTVTATSCYTSIHGTQAVQSKHTGHIVRKTSIKEEAWRPSWWRPAINLILPVCRVWRQTGWVGSKPRGGFEKQGWVYVQFEFVGALTKSLIKKKKMLYFALN